MRALLVDDSEELQMTAAWALSREGFETSIVKLGRDVPVRIKSFAPDVLILDLSAPDINGRMIAWLLRDHWPDLPIVLAGTRNGDVGPMPTRTELLAKPFSIDALVEAIVRLIYSPSSDL
ncbi:MAG TPA: response regulator [Thermoanaerobaculia bacterium]|nr:response regulator [Thermoanaerobaculia bacterium]